MNNAHNLTEWRDAVLDRDDYTCQFPNCEANTCLDAAHILPRRNRSVRLFVPNGVTLCRNHHDYLHQHPPEWEAFLAILREHRRAGWRSAV